MSPPLYHYWGSSTDQGVSTRDGFPIRTMLETREIVRGDPETAPAIARPFTVRSGRDSTCASTRAPPVGRSLPRGEVRARSGRTHQSNREYSGA